MSDPTVKYVGDGTCVWGSKGCFTDGVIVASASKQQQADKEEIKDNDGNVVGLVFFNERKQTTLAVQCRSTDTIPAVGDILTICGVANCVVEDVKEDWTQGASKKFSVTATAYKFLTPAA